MRLYRNINQNWKFTKNEKLENASFENINLPHTWNNYDGQNGSDDPYYRGLCWYKKILEFTNEEKEKEIYIEIKGANHISKTYINGTFLGEHKGGFSTFRYNLTKYLKFDGTDEILISVDNRKSSVYPQAADFTFFGGLYRDVNIIAVDKSHFSLDMYGSYGIFITPKVINHERAEVKINAFTSELKNKKVKIQILDADNNLIAFDESNENNPKFTLEYGDIRLWDGLENPYLYTLLSQIVDNETEEVIDEVNINFGLREFSVDPNKGFILNGKEYPLRGVSRHQCRYNMGWAITLKEHKEDIEYIKEVGATSIRLAHYQHDQVFYNLCDEKGLVLWAEIPFISVFMKDKEAYDNTISQMTELIYENYNHPSICFWGIANEITIGGDSEELLENLKALNKLCKELDPSRLTTIAHVSMLPIDSPQQHITDVVAYNHYFGWYTGSVEENGPWLDNFHNKYPNLSLGLSEYGCEGILKWHTDTPKRKDYTEEYQAYYHEKLLEQISERKYLWSTYVWNMFDFAADNRDEGGVKGRNNKGLMTFDRKIKKDSFFIYKAYWSQEPFVHITGRRYYDRHNRKIDVKVYSNQKEVTLYVNGVKENTLKGNKIFVFENVELKDGINEIKAVSNETIFDVIKLNKVENANENYILKDTTKVNDDARNWFKDLMPESLELTFKDGYYSIKDSLYDLMNNEETATILNDNLFNHLKSSKNILTGEEGQAFDLTSFKTISFEMIWDFLAKGFPTNALNIVNEKLQKIKK